MKKNVVLIILDGWGIGRRDGTNPIYVAKPQNILQLERDFPAGSLQSSGISVGLPWGEVGNSEVGHLTLGAGKVIYQYFPRIILSIRDSSFFKNTALAAAFDHARKNGSAVNLVGLLTNGNVHASLEHLQALVKMAADEKVQKVNLHLFSDGKDMPPHSLEKILKEIPLDNLATLTGRYYAMDRKENWNLTERTYRCLTGQAQKSDALKETLKELYAAGQTEEFLPPLCLNPEKAIADGDSVIFFNFREDSIKQLAESFILSGFDKFPIKKFQDLFIVTMTRYEEKFGVPAAFPPETVDNPLGKVLSDAGMTQLRLAETYKYSHVTYFFNGYREQPFKKEYRVLIPSPSATRMEEYPEMMSSAITDRLISAIEEKSFDFILVNYANPDTIAHTGNFEACLAAVRGIDKEIGRILKALNADTAVLITSDHGNLEEVVNPVTGAAETQHDPNPVPIYIVGKEFRGKKFVDWQEPSRVTGILSDVAPTILELMGIPKPKEMTGQSLLKSLI